MSPTEVYTLIGVGLTILTLVGAAIARDRALTSWFQTRIDAVREGAEKEAKSLHERINRVRDEYSRRTDLEAHMSQVQASLQGLATEVRAHTSETNKRLDNLVSVLIHQKTE